MKKVPVGNRSHEKASFVKKSDEPCLFHLHKVTDDLVVEVVDLWWSGDCVIQNEIYLEWKIEIGN